ncbi:MAG: [glutamine synthetase] adenylyltransferase / [glutamine synthetase]-adenylyl-L-tyrosine [Fimbriimonadaceae bacterium]|nr:[glutamine synthetase] adenylyltransferase / [glutamine synthetase]-adenylyl-L-tyrosine [Fimbriimonadaceae bacterium]
MSVFRDQETAMRAKERLEELAGGPLDRLFKDAFALSPNSDLALTNLERWLKAGSSAGPYLEQLQATPNLAKHLMAILGGSQPLADALIQNPELASILFDPQEISRIPSARSIEKEGEKLLSNSTSYSHSLDRLRYLKQRWTLPIVLNDLAGNWDEPAVWQALSELAEAIIRLTIRTVWNDSSLKSTLGETCPFLVVAFGKLGGRELNYSSDIDLVYAAPDDLPEAVSRDAQRFGEVLNRALSDSMGRGFLYRVDLRLRPYGGSGPLVPSMRSAENYYQLYSEPWETQALLRSRPIYGPESLTLRWQALRQDRCFGAKLSEASLDALTSMRTRIEERALANDLKRGAGGIRDVEFLTQILQLAHGRSHPSLQTLSTLDATKALEEIGLLDHAVAAALIQGYTFLRQLEHRCQLVADQQTHEIPESPESREMLAKLMGEQSWKTLDRHLDLHRRTISTLYQSIVHPPSQADTHRSRIGEQLGPLAHGAFQWFDALPDSDAFYEALETNEGSLNRVRQVLEGAPALINSFRRSVPLTELLLSGEIEESFCPDQRIDELHVDLPLPQVASTYADVHSRLAAQWLLEPSFDLSLRLSSLQDALVRHVMKRLYADFDVVALGSYGRQDLGLHSDADLVLLVSSADAQAEAEQQGQGLLSIFHTLKRHGAPVDVDLRLRPEGRQGLLVRTYDGLRAYELDRMEMWERFALGSARLVQGQAEAREVLMRAGCALPLTPERLKELTAMKKRIESERVQPQHMRRHVKLGHGGLGDIEWFVHLHEMRYPNATKAGENLRIEEGIRALGRARLVNAIEVEQLLDALRHLLTVRHRLALLGYKEDLVPENPDKLDRLAHVSGDKDGNSFLERHEHVIETVRAIYLEGMERLRA